MHGQSRGLMLCIMRYSAVTYQRVKRVTYHRRISHQSTVSHSPVCSILYIQYYIDDPCTNRTRVGGAAGDNIILLASGHVSRNLGQNGIIARVENISVAYHFGEESATC